jgi:hypothetical protein
MGVILGGIVSVVVLAIGAGYILRAEQEPAWQVYSTESARVGNPGQNLVGPDYTGEPGGSEAAAEGDETPS